MKPEKILYAMNDIDGDFLHEARENVASSHRRSRKFVALIAAVITLMAVTITAFAAIDWFHTFLERSRFTPESWSDAIIMEDYSEELLTEPVSGIPAYQFNGDGVIDLTVVSVRLRPGSLMLCYRATNSADYELLFDYYPGGVKVIMLDGTEIIRHRLPMNLKVIGLNTQEIGQSAR